MGERLSALENPAIDFALMGYSHDGDNDFRYVHLVDDPVIPDSNAVSVLSSPQTPGAQGNRVFGQAIDGRLCPVANLCRKFLELLGDCRLKKDLILRRGPLPIRPTDRVGAP